MTNFKEALLVELKTHTAAPQPLGSAAPQSWPRRRTLVAAGGVAAAAAVAVAMALNPFTAAPAYPAYAVDKNPDGSVSITWKDLADSKAATRDLRKAGVPAQVIQLSDPGTCPAPARSGEPWQYAGPGGDNGVLTVFSPEPDSRYEEASGWLDPQITDDTITLHPETVPAGAMIFIVQDKGPTGTIILGTGLVPSPAPTCWEKSR
jgi:hypothetical protein